MSKQLNDVYGKHAGDRDSPHRVCATCRFQDLVNMQGQIMRQMVCYRFPPNVSMVSLPQGVQATSMFPVVQPTWHCHEWAPRVADVSSVDPPDSYRDATGELVIPSKGENKV